MGKAAGDQMKPKVVKLPIEPRSVPEFLRELADELERDGGDNLRCAVSIVSEDGKMFRTRTRRFNLPIIEAVGVLHVSIHDLLNQ